MERKFAAEFLMPVGSHRFDVRVGEGDNATIHPLQVDVSGRYFFGVGLADVSVSRHSVAGSTTMLDAAGVRADESITRARLAFYGKARVDGRYLFTAQTDTTDRELERLFSGFTDTTPGDLFRRLDPDLYYPVYGDDSTTVRDVDSMGRLYLRMDWDQNSALWGNYNASVGGTEFAQYQRALYGAALQWRTAAANAWGDAASTLQAFGAQPDAVQGRSEFIGTGGSLYYLRHTGLLPGSEVVSVQVRDATTGRIEGQQVLTRGVDYEIDELQGRILLTAPLARITRRNVPTLSRDTPLDGFEQRLLVDYTWVPALLDDSSATLGARGKHWFGDHVAIGATHVREGRSGQDYQLDGVDLSLQAGQGTWLRAELARPPPSARLSTSHTMAAWASAWPTGWTPVARVRRARWRHVPICRSWAGRSSPGRCRPGGGTARPGIRPRCMTAAMTCAKPASRCRGRSTTVGSLVPVPASAGSAGRPWTSPSSPLPGTATRPARSVPNCAMSMRAMPVVPGWVRC